MMVYQELGNMVNIPQFLIQGTGEYYFPRNWEIFKIPLNLWIQDSIICLSIYQSLEIVPAYLIYSVISS